MLFFGKNRDKEECSQAVKRLETGMTDIKEVLETMAMQERAGKEAVGLWQSSMEESVGESVRGTAEIEARVKELERQIRRQSDSFEDLLEEIQEKNTLEERLKEERRESRQKEQALMALLLCCKEQMELLERQIQGDDSMDEGKRAAWHQQFEAMALERKRLMRPCGLEETGKPGEAVDYELCEVLEAKETGDREKAGTVARVYSRGVLQGGQVIKKAKVAAWKLADGEEAGSGLKG